MVAQKFRRSRNWDAAEDVRSGDLRYYLAVKNTFIEMSTPEDSDEETCSGSSPSPRRRNSSAPPSPCRGFRDHVEMSYSQSDDTDDTTLSDATDCASVNFNPSVAATGESEPNTNQHPVYGDLSSWFNEAVAPLNPNAASFEPAVQQSYGGDQPGAMQQTYSTYNWNAQQAYYDEAICHGRSDMASPNPQVRADTAPAYKPPMSHESRSEYARDVKAGYGCGQHHSQSQNFGASSELSQEQQWDDESAWSSGYRRGVQKKQVAANERISAPSQHQEATKAHARSAIITVMLKNIPCRKTQESIMQQVDDEGFAGQYDFFYVPQDVKCQANLGYAFINFPNPDHAAHFQSVMNGYRFPDSLSRKVCIVVPAHVQGMKANLAAFRRTEVMRSSRKPFFRASMGAALQQ